MLTAEQMRATLQRYLELVGRQDVDGVVALMTENVSVEDPVGGPPGTHVVGREAVARFFRKGFAATKPQPIPTGPIRTVPTGREAAMPFLLRLELAGRSREIPVIDVVRFDELGRIASLRAFWSLNEAR